MIEKEKFLGNRKHGERKEKLFRYSVRKCTLSAASVAVVSLLFLGNTAVSADEHLVSGQQTSQSSLVSGTSESSSVGPTTKTEVTSNKEDVSAVAANHSLNPAGQDSGSAMPALAAICGFVTFAMLLGNRRRR